MTIYDDNKYLSTILVYYLRKHNIGICPNAGLGKYHV